MGNGYYNILIWVVILGIVSDGKGGSKVIPCEICNKEPGDDTLHEFRCPICVTILVLCDSCYEKTKHRQTELVKTVNAYNEMDEAAKALGWII